MWHVDASPCSSTIGWPEPPPFAIVEPQPVDHDPFISWCVRHSLGSQGDEILTGIVSNRRRDGALVLGRRNSSDTNNRPSRQPPGVGRAVMQRSAGRGSKLKSGWHLSPVSRGPIGRG